ncbi:hypothetical protein SHL15_7652 [Streptomyces hygroscopicus subsp. limoneus]|nr:hypothetical protein SHL15_7652 [Streptomyces hygroscopicus subsp. limoneus]
MRTQKGVPRKEDIVFRHSTRPFVVGLCVLVAAAPAAPALALPAGGRRPRRRTPPTGLSAHRRSPT